MTIHRDLNRAGLGGNYTTWYLIQQMLAAGYTIGGSGSGTGGVWQAVTDVFQHTTNPMIGGAVAAIGVGVGSEDWGNALCWFALVAPDGTELVLQRDNVAGNATDDEWCYYYSPGGVLNYGAAAAAVAPIAADGRNLFGTINAAWPQIHGVGNVANLIHIAVDDALSTEGFSGLICVELIAVNTLRSVVMIDDLSSVPASGLFAPHAKTFHFATGAGQLLSNILSNVVNAPIALVDYGGGGEAWDVVPYVLLTDSGGTLYPGGAGAPASGEVPMPCIVGDRTHGGFGGLSRWLSYPAVIRVYNDRSTSELRWYIEDVQLIGLPDGVTVPATI